MLYKYMNSLKHYERLMCVWPKFNYRIKVDSLGKRLLHLLYFRETLVKTCSGKNLLERFRKIVRKRPPCSQVLLKLLTILKMQIFSQTIFLFVCVCFYVLLPQGFLLSRMMSEACIRIQVNDVLLRKVLGCLCQFSSFPFLNLSYFTSKDEISAHCNLESEWYMMNIVEQWWMERYNLI